MTDSIFIDSCIYFYSKYFTIKIILNSDIQIYVIKIYICVFMILILYKSFWKEGGKKFPKQC